MEDFIQDKIVSKFQMLKDGILFIKSQTNLENPQSRIVLWNPSIKRFKLPIFAFVQVIPTPIGPFVLSLNIDFWLEVRGLIAVRQFRSIDIGATLGATLSVELAFSYGLAYIL